jgi:hypothetical protein
VLGIPAGGYGEYLSALEGVMLTEVAIQKKRERRADKRRNLMSWRRHDRGKEIPFEQSVPVPVPVERREGIQAVPEMFSKKFVRDSVWQRAKNAVKTFIRRGKG